MTNGRRFDIVVYGATGFTGGLVVEYLAQHGPADLKWAIAGRSQGKLLAVRERAARKNPACKELPILSASAEDPKSLDAMASATRVVLTTVGPYARYGEPLVEACVRAGTDYVDITGEPDFVDRMIERYGDEAREKKLRIVSCCGFDSVPHDLGALFTAQELKAKEAVTIRGFVRSRAEFSGGTLHSAIGAIVDLGKPRSKSVAIEKAPQSKEAKSKRKVQGLPLGIYFEPSVDAWAVPLPTIDPVVVLRTARALDVFGPDFRYGHYAAVKRLPTVVGSVLGVGAFAAMTKIKATRDLLLKIREPGEGPSEETRRKAWFEVTFVGETASGKKVLTRVSGGDPGYDETSKMIAESALCLAFDRDQLPPNYGCVTPGAAMGDSLRKRLEAAGMKFQVLRRE